MASPKPEEIGRLQAAFQDADVSAHGPKWDALWRESFTPWDRGGPSLALADLVREKPDLFPASAKGGTRGAALVPGCGRGYDVLLLAALGYDVVGLDYSGEAVREAAANEQSVREGKNKEVYDGISVGERGTVTWVQGDFFDDAWLERVGRKQFDVIFDYTVSSICQFHFYRWNPRADLNAVLLRPATRGTPQMGQAHERPPGPRQGQIDLPRVAVAQRRH